MEPKAVTDLNPLYVIGVLVLGIVWLLVPIFICQIRNDVRELVKELKGIGGTATGQWQRLGSIEDCLSEPKPQGLFNTKGSLVGHVKPIPTRDSTGSENPSDMKDNA